MWLYAGIKYILYHFLLYKTDLRVICVHMYSSGRCVEIFFNAHVLQIFN